MAAKKLDGRGQDIVRIGLISGMDWNEINDKLKEAGYEPITEQGIAYYRNSDHVVKAAIEARGQVIIAAGLANYTTHVLELESHVNKIKRLMDRMPEEKIVNSHLFKEIAQLTELYFKGMDRIAKLRMRDWEAAIEAKHSLAPKPLFFPPAELEDQNGSLTSNGQAPNDPRTNSD